MSIKSLTIYCSSSENLSRDYYDLAEEIGAYLAQKSIKIIYGGGKNGLMGAVSSASYKKGGEVIGIIPKFLAIKEKISYETTQTLIVKNMQERKKKLFDMGDAFLILPGGPGTIEELTEVISWKMLGIHKKEIIIFNFDNFWDPLINMFEITYQKKFGKINLQKVSKHIKDINELKEYFLHA